MGQQKKRHKPYAAFKSVLASKGIRYKDIAELLQVSESTIQLKINGTSDFYISELCEICRTYNIEPNIFFTFFVANPITN